jgi:predicted amidohydrolase YtcJ
MNRQPADLIFHNGKIATQDDRRSLAEAAAIRDGRFLAVGSDREMMRFRDERTKLIDLNKRTVIPGLNDSHLHLIRGGLNYNLELRWDGVPSLADGLRMLREQAQRTPPGQWVRVVGGWTEFQFAERRMPTPLPPVLPEWSPVAAYGGYFKPASTPAGAHSSLLHSHRCEHHRNERQIGGGMGCLCWAF